VKNGHEESGDPVDLTLGGRFLAELLDVVHDFLPLVQSGVAALGRGLGLL